MRMGILASYDDAGMARGASKDSQAFEGKLVQAALGWLCVFMIR